MKTKVYFIVCVLLYTVVCKEQQCSQFHYEEQTLLKMLKLEVRMDQMMTDFENLQSELTYKTLGLQGDLNKFAKSLKDTSNQVNQITSQQSMSTYVRWGREDCPGNGTELMYKGYMAGNKWDKSGSGADSLCLPEAPSWAEYIDGVQSGATIYGTEIEAEAAVSSKLFGTNVNNNDISCAMCSSVRASMKMLPGYSHCLSGWTEEYQGYLVASHPNWAGSSDYVCLDGNFISGLDRGNNEHVVKIVEAQCGSLPCPPYVQGREIACVVCTK